jgi:alkanesulfonate monooxygenase SsuD/methylene tetrahydromethanopterin reductase-like flavin-dependent oxidoreductase (luciferase family)
MAMEYTVFGESGDQKLHAAMLDEGLTVLDRLWSGERVDHRGAHYTVEGVTLAPLPIQRPRIPIWIGGESGPALRRAARWDGWIVGGANQDGTMNRSPQQLAEKAAVIRQYRTGDATFEIAMTGYSTSDDGTLMREFAAAGVTWWLESLHGSRGSHTSCWRGLPQDRHNKQRSTVHFSPSHRAFLKRGFPYGK